MIYKSNDPNGRHVNRISREQDGDLLSPIPSDDKAEPFDLTDFPIEIGAKGTQCIEQGQQYFLIQELMTSRQQIQAAVESSKARMWDAIKKQFEVVFNEMLRDFGAVPSTVGHPENQKAVQSSASHNSTVPRPPVFPAKDMPDSLKGNPPSSDKSCHTSTPDISAGLPKHDSSSESRLEAHSIATVIKAETRESKPILENLLEDEAAAAAEPEGELYEGTIRLNISVNGMVQQALHFVRGLCRRPDIRFLRLMGGQKEELELWISLREPQYLQSTLRQMGGLIQSVGMAADNERSISIRLVEAPGTYN